MPPLTAVPDAHRRLSQVDLRELEGEHQVRLSLDIVACRRLRPQARHAYLRTGSDVHRVNGMGLEAWAADITH
jgi:hypothetical protein